VGVAVLVAAMVYSVLYFQNGLFRFESGGISIVLVLVWTAVVAVLLVVLWQRMLVREEYLRKFYVSDDTLFNFELGAVSRAEALPSNDPQGLVAYMRSAIAGLRYEGSPATPPEDFHPALCVSTNRVGKNAEDKDWSGVVQSIQQREDGHRTYVEVASFQNADELVHALEKHLV
jgi:hypothetical protein